MTIAVAAALLAAASPSPTAPPVDPERVSPGLWGFAFLLFLVVAVVIIWKSLNTQLRKVDFDEDATAGTTPRVDEGDGDRPAPPGEPTPAG